MMNPLIKITPQILNIISKIDEFKGAWRAIGNLAPDRLNSLKHVATIESIGSSTRIEGVKLTDREVEALLSGLDRKSFGSRDEQEVAGYADVMNTVFKSFNDIPLTENYIRQLQKDMLSRKIERENFFAKLPRLSRQIIELVKEHGQLSISEIESTTNVNRNTIKKRLADLVRDKHLIKQGQGRGTRYAPGVK